MSDQRVVVETSCEHGNMECREVVDWPLNVAEDVSDFVTQTYSVSRPCRGGSRRVLTEGVQEVWLCREGDERMQNWAYGPDGDPHCWFLGGGKHNPGCGVHLVIRADALAGSSDAS